MAMKFIKLTKSTKLNLASPKIKKREKLRNVINKNINTWRP